MFGLSDSLQHLSQLEPGACEVHRVGGILLTLPSITARSCFVAYSHLFSVTLWSVSFAYIPVAKAKTARTDNLMSSRTQPPSLLLPHERSPVQVLLPGRCRRRNPPRVSASVSGSDGSPVVSPPPRPVRAEIKVTRVNPKAHGRMNEGLG